MSKDILDGVRITVTFDNQYGYRTYTMTPVDNKPESLKYCLDKFLEQWEREKPTPKPQSKSNNKDTDA